MKRSRGRRSLIWVLSTLMVALPLAAVVEPDHSPVRDKAFRHPDLSIRDLYIPGARLWRDVPGARLWRDAPGVRLWRDVPGVRLRHDASEAMATLDALGVEPGNAYLDVRGGRWGTLIMSRPLLPGDGAGNELRWPGSKAPRDLAEHRRAAWDAFVAYLSDHESALGIDVDELRQPAVTVHRGGDLVQIYAPRIVAGIPVRDSYVTAVISHGNLILMGTRHWGDVKVVPAPFLSGDAAVAVVNDHLGAFAAGASWGKSSLALVPSSAGDRAYGYRLTWVTGARIEGDGGNWEAMVDAHSGELLKLEDTNRYATTRRVTGGVLPLSNDGVPPDGVEQPGWPMPFADVTAGGDTVFTDSGGNLLACVEGTATSTLSGRYMHINDSCGAISLSTGGEVLDFGASAGTDCDTPGVGGPGNTHAARTGFYELNRIQEQARGHLPDNEWLQQQLTANVNIGFSCGATWDGVAVNFYSSGMGCPNTGEIAGVLDHEWAHGMDANDALPSISSPSEGIADVYASLRLDSSCIGRGFLPAGTCGGYGDPCTECTGVRELDWAKRASGQPHGLSGANGIDALCSFGGGGPCGGSDHCEGTVYAETVWDLWHRDLTAPPFSWSVDAARELATQLTYLGGGAVGGWFQCAPPFGGCNADGGYLNFLAADDDDGDLAGGTPHMSAIFAAFDRHEIACDTPAVADSGCGDAVTTAPAVTAAALDRGASLSWAAVPNAVAYNVYRGEGVDACDWGKELVATTPDTSFVDSGLMNGMEYYYLVIPIGPGATCFGPASSCTALTPAAGDNLALDRATSGDFSFTVSDGDVFLDNCEEGTVQVAVANIGTGNQTGVRITGVRPIGHPEVVVTTALPLVISVDLAACETAQAEIGIFADGLSLGDAVDLEIDFTSDQLGALIKTQTVRIAVPATESDLESSAARTFSFESDLEDWRQQQDTFDRTGTGGGDGTTWFVASSDDLDDRCDRIRSPLMILSSTSTLALWNNFDIEPQSAGSWYDRANVGLIDDAGERTLISPDGGRLYNADSSGVGNYGGCNEPEEGWADTQDTWGTSSWTSAALQSPVFAGELVQLEVIYATDAAVANRGFWFDQVTVTDLELQIADAQSDVCSGPGGIFANGFESGDTSAWSATVSP